MVCPLSPLPITHVGLQIFFVKSGEAQFFTSMKIAIQIHSFRFTYAWRHLASLTLRLVSWTSQRIGVSAEQFIKHKPNSQ